MATGRSNYLTKQAGEYLVAAELSRRGYIATTFTGNLPDYDIIALKVNNKSSVAHEKNRIPTWYVFSCKSLVQAPAQ